MVVLSCSSSQKRIIKYFSMDYDVVTFGEVLWDILPTGALPGGAPMNVAYHLHKLGVNPALITRIGDDKYGSDLIKLLDDTGVPVKYEVDEEQPTGLVYARPGANHEMQYDIVYPSAWDFIEWNQEIDNLVASADYFVFGSLTSRSKTSRETLHKLLKSSKINVFDINLRPPHYQQDQLEFLLEWTDVLKMNLAELELVTEWYDQKGDTENRIRFVQDRFHIDTIIVTKGGDGAIVNDEGEVYRHPGYQVEVEDTIGSGDSFLAGFLAQRLGGSDIETALDFAAGIGAFIATQPGGCPQYEISQIKRLMEEG